MSIEPTNDELSANFARQIDEARHRREQSEQDRLTKAGRQAAAMDDHAAEQQDELAEQLRDHDDREPEANAIEQQMDNAKEERKVELLERFKEKAGRDREAEREHGR